MSVLTIPRKQALSSKLQFYVVVMVLSIITVYALSAALTRGVANAWYFHVEFSLNAWADDKTQVNIESYENTLTSIKKAQSLDPTHPHYAHMLGRVLHWGVDLGYEDRSRLTDVKEWYVLATKLRPMWPDPWADLVRLNNYLNGFTDETKYYINQALTMGPYNDFVRVSTMKVWLMNWSVLSGEERAALYTQFDLATKHYAKLEEILNFAKNNNKEKVLCSQLKYNPVYKAHKTTWLYKKSCLN